VRAKQRSAEASQLSLFDAQEPAPVAQPEARKDVQVEREPIICDGVQLAAVKRSAGEWATIRMRLLRWARAQGYPEVSFPIGKHAPDYRGGIVQQGEDHWIEMFQKGGDEFILCLVRHIERGGK
jgi:hypothetical protein